MLQTVHSVRQQTYQGRDKYFLTQNGQFMDDIVHKTLLLLFCSKIK